MGLLKAAADGAAANVRINLDGLKDQDYKAAVDRDLASLSAAGSAHVTAAMQALA